MLKDTAAGYIEVVGIENIPQFAKTHQTNELELVINGQASAFTIPTHKNQRTMKRWQVEPPPAGAGGS